MPHDFNKFPELTNGQMEIYYFESPHKQITSNFRGEVVRVVDGDTVRVFTEFRDFVFPVRFLDLAAPEKKEEGGRESKEWLEQQILGEEVDFLIDPSMRVGKWGRLLAKIFFAGVDIGQESIRTGHALDWNARIEGQIPNFDKQLEGLKWS